MKSDYILFRKLRFNRSDAATLMNLCLALIVAEFVFACGMHRTDDQLLCKGVAMALHYFLLCALVWLGCGGVVLIRLLKKKSNSCGEYDPVLKYYLVGWGKLSFSFTWLLNILKTSEIILKWILPF